MRWLWSPEHLLGLLLLSVTVQAAPVVSDTSDIHNPIVTTIEVGDGSPKVEIHIIEVVKTVTETEGICTHTTGLNTGVAMALETPVSGTTTSVRAERTSTTYQETPAATSLIPAVHWDVDVHRVENLQANKSVDMFYCEHKLERTGGKASPPSNNTAVGFLKIENMQYPSVQLEHTAYIASVGCYNDSVRVVFNNRKAFSIAHADWSSHKSGVVLITTDPQCRLSTELTERGYILVKSVTVDNSTMTIVGRHEPVSFADAVGHETPIDFSFGNFQTNSTDGFNVPAAGSPGKANGAVIQPPLWPTNTTAPFSNTTLRDPSGDTSFDEDLDRTIGVMTNEEFETQMLGRYNVSLKEVTGDDIPDLLPGHKIRRRHLKRRGLFGSIKKGLKKIGKAVKDTVNKVGHVVKEVTGKVGDVIEKGIDTIGHWLSITKSFNKDFSFDTKKNQHTTETPWGAGVELFSKSTPGGSGSAAVYCVDCGAEGKMVLEGKVTFSIIKGLEAGYISADGNLHAGLQIGIVASFKDHWGFEKEIVNVPLTPYTIPGIITLGPSLSLAAGAELDILAEGQLLAGITADVPNFSARFDLKDHDKSVMPNFGPEAKPVFDGKGKIVLSADAYLALKLAVGVNILSGVFDKSVGIVEKPKLTLKAGVDASFSLEGGGQFADPNCKGLSIELGFGNEVYFDVFGKKKMVSDAKGPSWDHCFVLQKDHNAIQGEAQGNTTIQEGVQGNSTVPAENQGNTTFWEPPSNESPPALTPAAPAPAHNSVFSRLMTLNGALGLHYSPNANIYAVPPQKVEDPNDISSVFTSDPSGDFIIGDSHGRYLHGYKTEINSFGVGRLRLHTADAMPKTASLLSFASTYINATGESLAVLADLTGAIYFPVVCMYEAGIFPKLFLAKDPVAGIAKLEDEKLESVITGSKVKACGYLPMRQETLH